MTDFATIVVIFLAVLAAFGWIFFLLTMRAYNMAESENYQLRVQANRVDSLKAERDAIVEYAEDALRILKWAARRGVECVELFEKIDNIDAAKALMSAMMANMPIYEDNGRFIIGTQYVQIASIDPRTGRFTLGNGQPINLRTLDRMIEKTLKDMTMARAMLELETPAVKVNNNGYKPQQLPVSNYQQQQQQTYPALSNKALRKLNMPSQAHPVWNGPVLPATWKPGKKEPMTVPMAYDAMKKGIEFDSSTKDACPDNWELPSIMTWVETLPGNPDSPVKIQKK